MLRSEEKRCRRGHDAPRRRNGNCVECEKERYRNDGKTKRRMAQKSRDKWAALKSDSEAMESHREYMRKYADRNREKLNVANRTRYAENRVRIQLLRKGIKPDQKLIEAIENHHFWLTTMQITLDNKTRFPHRKRVFCLEESNVGA